MSNNYFEKLTEISKKIQEPFQQMAELNIRTLQNFTYVKPEELMQLKKPEQILEKQVKVFLDNGHKALEHLQQSFAIFENTLVTLLHDIKEKTQVKE